MPKEIHSPERALRDPSAPKEIVVDQGTAARFEELCSTMTDTCGLIEATLQLAIEGKGIKRLVFINTALNLSARGTRAIKMFLSEWSVLVEDSKSREKSGRSARDSELVILTPLTAHDPAAKNQPQPSAETERERK